MKQLPSDSVSSIVTDPPYELGFMGKKWDSSGIAYNIDVWKEALRVLKPGGHLLAFGGTRTYHRMTCAIEDAGFEIRDCIQWIYGCLSDDTECLTLNGWKKFKELSDRDKVMQWNYKTNELSWVLPEKIMSYPAPKTMIHMANRHTDQLLTENHRVYARFRKHSRNRDTKEYTVELAGNMKKHWIKSLPLAGNLNDGIDVYEPYMVGWWCTDAWIRNDGCKAAMFSQSKPATLKKLQDALDACDCKYSEYIKDRHSKNPRQNDEHTFYVTGKLATYLLDHYPQRKLSWNMMLWSYDSRWKLLDGLLDGDGSRHANDEYAETFWSKTPGRLDFVQALCLSLNIRSYIDYKKGAVYLNRKTNETQCQSKHTLESIDYNGKLVWCLQVPEHAFVVRRNGKAFITGNSGFPKSMDISKAIDKRLGNWHGRNTCVTSQSTCMNGGNYKRTDKGNPITDEAKQWDGWGTCLKPANEPIVLARKPIKESTIADNVLKFGTGGINIDDTRILSTNMPDEFHRGVRGKTNDYGEYNADCHYKPNTNGRFPSNVILDETASAMLDEQTGITKSTPNLRRSAHNKVNLYGSHGSYISTGYSDIEGASRFFYCAKASKKERNMGGINNHPTVKPIKLMEYLVKLVTPPNGTVLDPFMGSGSTCIAAHNLGFPYIGIEENEDYYKIAKERIDANVTSVQ